jgi:hypothetical protein
MEWRGYGATGIWRLSRSRAGVCIELLTLRGGSRFAPRPACCVRGGEFVMGDTQKYRQGLDWYFFLDATLVAAVVVPVALVLFLI